MRKKLMALAMCLGIGAAMLTGCGKPTVESLIDGMNENQPESQTGEVEIEMVLSFESEGISIDFGVESDVEYQMEGNPAESDDVTLYLDGDVIVGILGMSKKFPIEGYMITEDDETTMYTYDTDNDTWYYSISDGSDSGDLDSLMDPDITEEVAQAMTDVIKENGELAEDTEKVAGVECYVITLTLAGDDLVDICKPFDKRFLDLLEEAGVDDHNIKFSSYMEYCNADITYYISKEDGWLVKSVVDMSDSDIYGMIEAIMSDLDMDMEIVIDDIDNIYFKKCSVTVTITDQNNTEVKVPRDVKNNAIEGGSVDFDDIYDGISGGYDTSDFGWDDDYGYDWDDDDADWDDNDYDWDDDDDDDRTWYNSHNDRDDERSDDDNAGDIAGVNDDDGNPDIEYITLNKCDEDDELLCEVTVPDGYTYDNRYSNPEDGYFYLDYKYGGYLSIINEAYYPLYFYLANGDIPTEEKYSNYECDVNVIGTAFGGSDCMLIEETYYDAVDKVTYEETYLAMEYSDGGFIEYLVVYFADMDIDDWSDSDYLKLARDLFGR